MYGWQPDGAWGTNPQFKRDNDTYRFYVNDHLGTPQQIDDATGNPVWRATFQAFGQAKVDSSSTLGNALRFPGQYYDSETGTHYNYFRDYDPATGRYISEDPVGLSGGMNLYRYAAGSPTNVQDPLGLAEECVTLGSITIPGYPEIVGRGRPKYTPWSLDNEHWEELSEKGIGVFGGRMICFIGRTVTQVIHWEWWGDKISWGYCIDTDCGRAHIRWWNKSERTLLDKWDKTEVRREQEWPNFWAPDEVVASFRCEAITRAMNGER